MRENLVVDLDVAKRLKEAGWDKRTRYCYYIPRKGSPQIQRVRSANYRKEGDYLAPHASEIAEVLPKRVDIDDPYHKYGYLYMSLGQGIEGYQFGYDSSDIYGEAETMADALAELWIKLQEN